MDTHNLESLKEQADLYVEEYKKYLMQFGRSEAQVADLVEQKRSTLFMFIDYLESDGDCERKS